MLAIVANETSAEHYLLSERLWAVQLIPALGFRESNRRKDKIAMGEAICKSLWEALKITHDHLHYPLGQEAKPWYSCTSSSQ